MDFYRNLERDIKEIPLHRPKIVEKKEGKKDLSKDQVEIAFGQFTQDQIKIIFAKSLLVMMCRRRREVSELRISWTIPREAEPEDGRKLLGHLQKRKKGHLG